MLDIASALLGGLAVGTGVTSAIWMKLLREQQADCIRMYRVGTCPHNYAEIKWEPAEDDPGWE